MDSGRDSHEKGSAEFAITLAAAHSGLVGPPGADRLHTSFTKGPIIFAPYLRMRSVAPLVDALSLSMGSKLEFCSIDMSMWT